MKNITIITDKEGNEFAIIDHGNEQFTSMPKADYEAQLAAQVEHLTEISTGAKEL